MSTQFSPFPDIVLTDPAGIRQGHVTSSGTPVAHADDGRPVTELTGSLPSDDNTV